MKLFKKVMAVMLMLAICIGLVGVQKPTQTQAAAKMYRKDFIVATVKAMEGQYRNGAKISYKLNSDGSVQYMGKTVSASTVNSLKTKYEVDTATAQYLAIGADMGLYSTSASYYKSKKAIGQKANYKAALSILVAADEYLYGAKVSSDDLALAKSRITNLKKAGSSSYQTIFAKAFVLGYYAGTKTANYSKTRTIKPTSKISKTTGTGLVAMLTDKSKRIQLTDDMQVIRTTKLPRTANLYPYILDSYPNAYYDTSFNNYKVMKTQTAETGFKERLQKTSTSFWPFEYSAYCHAGDNECVIKSQNRDYDKEYENIEAAIEFYTYAMNVDYRTIKNDTEWFRVMNKYLSKEYLNTYIEACIRNKTIVECDVVAGDISSCYIASGGDYFKIYLHFRVVSDKVIEKGEPLGSDIVYGVYDDELVPVITQNRGDSKAWLLNGPKYELGEWIDYYTSPMVAAGDKLGICDLGYWPMYDTTGDYPELYHR